MVMTIENDNRKLDYSIDLSVEELKRLHHYDPETGIFTRLVQLNNRYADVESGGERVDGYIAIYVCGKRYLAHRLAWFYMYGTWPKYIDHKNQIRQDNRLDNLREATHAQNNINKYVQSNNYLGVKGIKAHGNKFIARITFQGVTHYLGLFHTIAEAAAARKEAEREFYGEFAQD